jgi:hypothetical protein
VKIGAPATALLASLTLAGTVAVPLDSAPPAPGQSSPVTFKDGTAAAGIDFVHTNGASPEKFLAETMGSGVVLFDYNNDGRLDIFLVDGGTVARSVSVRPRHRLYSSRGDGTFEERGAAAGLRHAAYGQGACAGDVDGDGWVDLYITNVGPNVLYRNTGQGTFTDISARAGVANAMWGASCTFFDFDRDSDLDLFVTNYVNAGTGNNPPCGDARSGVRDYCHPLVFDPYPNVLYRNDGAGRFTNISAQAGLATLKANGLGVVASDFDDDGWPDVFVANDGMPNFLFRNRGGTRFEENGLLSGVAVAPDGQPRAGMGAASGDYDGDGRVDLMVTNLWGETHSLFRNLGGGLFAYATVESGIGPPTLPFVGFGTTFADYDNDSHLDLVVVNGAFVDHAIRAGSTRQQRRLLFRNGGSRRFVEVGATVGAAFSQPRVGRGLAVGDIDNDGDLDLIVSNNGGRADLLINDGGNAGQAVLVRTIGTTSNRDGIGARLVMTVAGRTLVREVQGGSGYLSQSDMRAHFGLGAATTADRLEVRWPGGRVDVLLNVSAGQFLTVREGEGVVAREPLRTRRVPSVTR